MRQHLNVAAYFLLCHLMSRPPALESVAMGTAPLEADKAVQREKVREQGRTRWGRERHKVPTAVHLANATHSLTMERRCTENTRVF